MFQMEQLFQWTLAQQAKLNLLTKKSLDIDYQEFNSLEEIPQVEIRSLINDAIVATETAYAPYSNFYVGASVLMSDGSVFKASNQENASFPVGTCAERALMHYVHANHPDLIIKAIAVTVRSETLKILTPVAPCGMCRQALLEYERNQEQPYSVYLHAIGGPTVQFNSVSDLLPLHFFEKGLKK